MSFSVKTRWPVVRGEANGAPSKRRRARLCNSQRICFWESEAQTVKIATLFSFIFFLTMFCLSVDNAFRFRSRRKQEEIGRLVMGHLAMGRVVAEYREAIMK